MWSSEGSAGSMRLCTGMFNCAVSGADTDWRRFCWSVQLRVSKICHKFSKQSCVLFLVLSELLPNARQVLHLSVGPYAVTVRFLMFLRLGSFTSLIFVSQDVICSSRAASALHRVLVGMLWIDRPVAWTQLRLREEPTGDARLLDPTCHATTQVQAQRSSSFLHVLPGFLQHNHLAELGHVRRCKGAS